MKNKTFDEAREALHETSEYKAYVEADEAFYEARKAKEEAREAKDEAWEAVEATPEWKDYLKAKAELRNGK